MASWIDVLAAAAAGRRIPKLAKPGVNTQVPTVPSDGRDSLVGFCCRQPSFEYVFTCAPEDDAGDHQYGSRVTHLTHTKPAYGAASKPEACEPVACAPLAFHSLACKPPVPKMGEYKNPVPKFGDCKPPVPKFAACNLLASKLIACDPAACDASPAHPSSAQQLSALCVAPAARTQVIQNPLYAARPVAVTASSVKEGMFVQSNSLFAAQLVADLVVEPAFKSVPQLVIKSAPESVSELVVESVPELVSELVVKSAFKPAAKSVTGALTQSSLKLLALKKMPGEVSSQLPASASDPHIPLSDSVAAPPSIPAAKSAVNPTPTLLELQPRESVPEQPRESAPKSGQEPWSDPLPVPTRKLLAFKRVAAGPALQAPVGKVQAAALALKPTVDLDLAVRPAEFKAPSVSGKASGVVNMAQVEALAKRPYSCMEHSNATHTAATQGLEDSHVCSSHGRIGIVPACVSASELPRDPRPRKFRRVEQRTVDQTSDMNARAPDPAPGKDACVPDLGLGMNARVLKQVIDMDARVANQSLNMDSRVPDQAFGMNANVTKEDVGRAGHTCWREVKQSVDGTVVHVAVAAGLVRLPQACINVNPEPSKVQQQIQVELCRLGKPESMHRVGTVAQKQVAKRRCSGVEAQQSQGSTAPEYHVSGSALFLNVPQSSAKCQADKQSSKRPHSSMETDLDVSQHHGSMQHSIARHYPLVDALAEHVVGPRSCCMNVLPPRKRRGWRGFVC